MGYSTKELYLFLEITIFILAHLLFIAVCGLITGDWLTVKEYFEPTTISFAGFLYLFAYAAYSGSWVTRMWFEHYKD